MKAGEISFDFVTNLAKLQGELAQIRRAVGQTMGEAAAQHNDLVRSSERLVKSLEREATTFGMTTAEIRDMDVATKALALSEAGLTVQAERLVTAHRDLAGIQATAAAGAAAAAKVAEAAAAAEAAAIRDAAIAYQQFEERARAGTLAIAMEEAAAAANREAVALRDAGIAHQQFETRVREGAQALREQDAAVARDAATLQRLRDMLDPAAAAEKRLAAELEDVRRVMVAAGHSTEDVTRVQALMAQHGGAVTAGLGAQRAGFQQLAMNMGDVATSYQGGIKLSTIFAQQSGQLAQAIALVAGEAKGFAGFLGGPWFIAFTAAVTLIMALASSHGEAKTKAEEEADALKTVKGAIEALDEATGRLHKSKMQQIDDSARATTALLKEAIAHRQVLAAQQQSYTAQLNAPGASDDALASSIALGLTGRAVTANDAKIKSLQDALSGVGFAKAVDAATAATSKAAKATKDYEAQIERIQAAWGRSGKTAHDQLLVQQLAADAMRKRDAVTKAATVSATGMIGADAALASASNSVQRAEAAVAKVRAENAVGLAAHSLTQQEATARLAAAERGLYAARDAQKAHTAAVRDGVKEAREAAQALDRITEAQGKYATRTTAEVESLLDAWSKPMKAPPSILEGLDLSKVDTALSEMRAHEMAPLLKDMEHWEDLTSRVQDAAYSLGDAWGDVGHSIGDAMGILADYGSRQARMDQDHQAGILKDADYAKKSADLQLNSLIGLTDTAKNLFSEHSKGYKAMAAAEKALTIIQLARTAVDVAGGAARMFATLGPLAFPAVGAMLAVMASLGFGGGGSAGAAPTSNQGKGTVLGASDATSDSLKNSIEMLSDIDRVTMTHSAEMAASLKSIDQHIGGLASLLVRTGNISGAVDGVNTGFKSTFGGNSKSGAAIGAGLGGAAGFLLGGPITGGLGAIVGGAIGSVLSPVIKSLFGTKTSVVGSGLFAGSQDLSSILSGGLDLQTYADIQKKKKMFGITTGTKYSTQYGGADPQVEAQFALILKSFYDAIGAAAVPLGEATAGVQGKLDNFVVNLGKIDFTGLSGDEIQKKLEAVFGAAADSMASAAFPGIEKWQAVGEGAFETLTRVASTVESVTTGLETLGLTTKSLGVDASMSLAGLFDSVDAMNGATSAYFTTFYTEAEQAAAKTKQLTDVFSSLGMTLPDSIASYRALVDAQDLTTAAGQSAYAALIQLAPAFAQMTAGAQDATSAAAIVRERQDLEKQLLELQGDTAAIRAAELATLDPSNRAIQERINALKDEQAAEQAASQIAEQRAGLERQLLDINGDTAATRALDLAGMDESLRALQQLVWARQDDIAATQASAAAAAQVAQERMGLEQQLLELQGNTDELRRRERDALDPANRALYDQIQALKDQQAAAAAAAQADQAAQQAAQEAAQAADQLRQAWSSIADSLLDEVNRIRGLNGTSGMTFAQLLGQFNAASTAARGGDQDAAKNLPNLSKALLDAAAESATSQQELARVQAQTAASLEATYNMIHAADLHSQAMMGAVVDNGAAASQAWWNANAPANDTGSLQAEVQGLRSDLQAVLSDIAGSTRKTARVLDDVSRGEQTINTVAA
jgi:hypothetical protein